MADAATVADDLAFALDVADEADMRSLRHFERVADLEVETKADLSPVTEADRSVETMVRDRLATERPDDRIRGEEFGDGADGSSESGPGGRRWVVDPIDGTLNFIRGAPVWATLLALEVDGTGVVGVVSAPALGMRWWAARGGGAFRGGETLRGGASRDGVPIRVSDVDEIDRAALSYDSVPEMERFGLGERLLTLARSVYRSRGFGDFWSHMLVAQGACDIAVEPRVHHWDWAPLRVIVEEAGGHATDISGETLHGDCSILTTNGLLHDRAVAAFGTDEPGRG